MSKNILIFVPKGVELMELSPFIDIFGWAKEISKIDIDFVTTGFSKEIKTAFNQTFVVDNKWDEIFCSPNEIDILSFDALVIPGGFGQYGFYEEAYDERILSLINCFFQEKKPIATVCVASLILAKSGVLIEKNATTYNKDNGRKQALLAAMGVNVINDPIVIDDNIITSYNPQTAPYVAFVLLEKLSYNKACHEVMDNMGFPPL